MKFALVGGTISQGLIDLPIVGFMIGSFMGSVLGSFVYNSGYSKAISFCIEPEGLSVGLLRRGVIGVQQVGYVF